MLKCQMINLSCFLRADDLGRAVEELVTVITEQEIETTDDIEANNEETVNGSNGHSIEQ